MAIGILFEYPKTIEHWHEWSFANMAHHRDIIRRIYERTGRNLPESILDPFDLNDPTSWSYKHQEMHERQNAVLGIQGFNLLGVDWKDDDQMEAWIASHANEHVQAATILGMG